VRGKAQLGGIGHRLFHQFAGATGFKGNHGKAFHVVIPDAPLVVLGVALFIDSQLRAQAEKWTPNFGQSARLDFSGSAGSERTAEL
jgi:hypothetical protein